VVDEELQTFWGWSYERFVTVLLESTDIQEGDFVLDVATGTAVIPLEINNQKGIEPRIVGLDITPTMLTLARQKLDGREAYSNITFTCASAMIMPFRKLSFDVAMCGLATHHMDVPTLVSEIGRVLKPRGKLTIADVGGSPLWRLPFINTLIRVAAFLYFLPGHGVSRAWAEGAALSNVRTAEEWESLLTESGFTDIAITKLATSHYWAPPPLVITAVKNSFED
jgi:ubiquinone/menaquinone biosynthesis C-methylase UbiE